MRVKVLLAQAPHRDTFGYSMPPPGLLRLGGALLAHGVAVELDDLAHALAAGELPAGDALAEAACERLRAHGDVALLGLSVMGATVPIALAILARVRERAPHVRIALGGPGTTGVDVTLLERFSCIDFVVRGEGEVTLRELVDALARGADASGIAGLTFRAADGTIVREMERAPIADLAQLPPYAWHLLPAIRDYKRVTGGADGLVALDSGRGCVYDCSFCTIGRFWSRRSRVVPARVLALDVAALRGVEGARSAYLCHDLFGANRGHAIALCDELAQLEPRVPWEVRARADHLDRELLERMGAAGCYRVLIGVESADAGVRERNQKGMRRDVELLEVVDDCARAGIVPILSLILGLPGEDERALRASLDFCARAALRAGVQLSLHLVNPQPGCGLHEEFGARARPVEDIPPDMAWGAGDTLPERELRDAHPDLFTTWALLPDDETHLRALHDIARELPDVLMRFPRAWTLLARARGADTLDLWRAWRADGRSFETFARASRDARVTDALAWEQALVRVDARMRGAGQLDARIRGAGELDARGPHFAGEIVALEHDLASWTTGGASGDCAPRPTWLAVLPGQRGVQTLRVGRDAARCLAQLDGRRTLAELDTGDPALAFVARQFATLTAGDDS